MGQIATNEAGGVATQPSAGRPLPAPSFGITSAYLEEHGLNLTQGPAVFRFGKEAGGKITTGADIFLAGEKAGTAITTAHHVFLVGEDCGEHLTTGAHNFVWGERSLQNATTGTRNIGAGKNVLRLGNPSKNVVFGCEAAEETEGEENVVLGDNALHHATGATEKCAIVGASAFSTSEGVNKEVIAIGPSAGQNSGNEQTATMYIGWGENNVIRAAIVGGAMRLGFYNVAPVARHAALVLPAENFPAQKTFNEAVIAVLKNVGLTE